MQTERIQRVCIDVKNLDEGIKQFSAALGITFNRVHMEPVPFDVISSGPVDPLLEKVKTTGIAVSETGVELVETDPPCAKEGIRSVIYKVPNLEESKAAMEKKGVGMMVEVVWKGGLKEAVFGPVNLHGVRLALIEYTTPTLFEAMMGPGK
ncbi:MAG: hypothetical protein HY669_01910 [Chloroflexi bacterium]|nr:hypothetical protein [Chloroflexota bacterium]